MAKLAGEGTPGVAYQEAVGISTGMASPYSPCQGGFFRFLESFLVPEERFYT